MQDYPTILHSRMRGECPEGQWAPADICVPMPPEMILETQMRKEERLEINLECAKEFGLPECLIHKTCTPEDAGLGILGYGFGGEGGSLKNSKAYQKSKCFEMCTALKQGEKNSRGVPQDIKVLKHVQDQMKKFGCNKYRSGGTNAELKKALPWIIGTAVVLVLIYKFR